MNDLTTNVNKAHAFELHSRILANGAIIASALVQFCKELKEMRDDELYKELDYNSFDDYVESEVGLKSRQAYTYISTYESWGPRLLEQNAQFGITKLEILRHLPATDREDILSENDIGGMSTKEVKELVDKLNNYGEQIDLLTQTAATADDTATALQKELDLLKKQQSNAASVEVEQKQKEIEKLNKLLDELKAQPVDVSPSPVIDEKKIKAEATKLAKQDFDKKLAEIEKTKADDISKAIADAKEKATADAKALADAGMQKYIATADAEKAAAISRATELEKKLQLAQSEESTAFALHFDMLQQSYLKMLEQITALNEKGKKEQATKLQAALKKALASFANGVEG